MPESFLVGTLLRRRRACSAPWRTARAERSASTTSTRPTRSTASTRRWGSGARACRCVTLLAGLVGLTFALVFQFYTTVLDWPLNVGGKPDNSTLAFVPICFELTVLIGGLATVGAPSSCAPGSIPGKREQLAVRGVTNDVFALVVRAAADRRRPRGAPARCSWRAAPSEVEEREADAVTRRSAPGSSRSSRAGAALACGGCGAGGETARASSTCPTWRAAPPTRRSRPTRRRATASRCSAPVAGHDPARLPAVPLRPRRGGGRARRTRAREPAPPRPPPTLEDGRGLYQTYCVVCHGDRRARATARSRARSRRRPPTRPARVSPFPPGRIFHVDHDGLGQDAVVRGAAQRPTSAGRSSAYVHDDLQGLARTAPPARRAP